MYNGLNLSDVTSLGCNSAQWHLEFHQFINLSNILSLKKQNKITSYKLLFHSLCVFVFLS